MRSWDWTGEHAVEDADSYLDRWTEALESARTAGVPVIHLHDDGVDDPFVGRGSPDGRSRTY